MKRIKYIILLFLIACQYGCVESTKVHVDIPMSDIALSQPKDKAILDLNNEQISEYRFVWTNSNSASNTIIFSSNRTLKPQYTIETFERDQVTLTLEEMDQCLSFLEFKNGEVGTIYWTVKPTERLNVASTCINSFEATRIRTLLYSPIDKSEMELNVDTKEQKINFLWDNSAINKDEDYCITFSLNVAMTNSIDKDVEYGGATDLTHLQMDQIMEQLGTPIFAQRVIYWNIKSKRTGQLLSRTNCSLNLTRLMEFTDTRGSESINYRAARIKFANGTSQIWLAENLRATKYSDGTDIPSAKRLFPEEGLDIATRKAYGGYYHYSIKHNIAPTGWRLPTEAEYKTLFAEAAKAEGQWNVLKHKDYWPTITNKVNMNLWKLGLVSSGRTQNMTAINNHKTKYCYLLAICPDEAAFILHDGGATLWPTSGGVVGSPARFIFNEK